MSPHPQFEISRSTSGACPVFPKSTHVFSVESSPHSASSNTQELANPPSEHSWSTTLLPQVSLIEVCNCIVSSHSSLLSSTSTSIHVGLELTTSNVSVSSSNVSVLHKISNVPSSSQPHTVTVA